MAAPKGNQFWKLRSSHGRKKLFESPELLWEAACEYFQWCIDNPLVEEKLFHSNGVIIKGKENKMRPFTLIGVCHYCDCNKGYFNDFESALKEDKTNLNKDFSVVITRIREVIYKQKFEGAAAGFLNPNIIARDLGLADKKEVEQKGSLNITTSPLTQDEIDSYKKQSDKDY